MNDGDFYIFVLDLLVARQFRGRSIGRKLMECVRADYPGQIVFVLSDVDAYYVKQGYKREGSIFKVT
jgi:GNAT superfamily N-acetyltransferase